MTSPPGHHRHARSTWSSAVKRSAKAFGRHGGFDLAAMLTFFSVLSLAPALLAVFSMTTLVLASNATTVTSLGDDLVRQYVPAEYQDLVMNIVTSVIDAASGGGLALTIGIAVALWSSSIYVRAFSRCMNIVYGRNESRGLVKRTAIMLLTTLIVLISAVLILVSLALNPALVTGLLGPLAEPLGLSDLLTFMTDTFLPIWAWVKWPIVLALMLAIIALLYYFTPDASQPRNPWSSPGPAVAIVGIALAGGALYFYSAYFTGFNPYGAIGTVMALLIALWLTNIVLLLGAEVDADIQRTRATPNHHPPEEQ